MWLVSFEVGQSELFLGFSCWSLEVLKFEVLFVLKNIFKQINVFNSHFFVFILILLVLFIRYYFKCNYYPTIFWSNYLKCSLTCYLNYLLFYLVTVKLVEPSKTSVIFSKRAIEDKWTSCIRAVAMEVKVIIIFLWRVETFFLK